MFQESFIFNIPTTVLTGGTGIAFTEINSRIPNFDFEFRRTIHTATDNRIYLKILDPVTSKYLYNGSPDMRTISGTSLSGITPYGFLPFNWPNPHKMQAGTLASFYLSDFSGSSNTIDLSYHGIGHYKTTPIDRTGKPVDFREQRTVTPYVITSDSIVAAAGVGNDARGFATVQGDADFVCTKITGIATGDGYVSIQDSQRGLDWQQGRTRISNLIGNGQFPNVLVAPRFIGQTSSLDIKWENNTGSTNTLVLFFHGFKRF